MDTVQPKRPNVNDAARKPGRVTLSRDVSALLVELSIALHKHAMYPIGHPSLGPAAGGVERRAARLLDSRSRIAIGVARRQLIIEGVATDPGQPVLRRLAEALHRHHLGAISLDRGVEVAEIGAALFALSADPEREGPLGLTPADRRPRWTHVHLHPLTFDRLALMTEPGGDAGTPAGRGAELWIGLAHAALAGDSGAPAPGTPPAMSAAPAVVARAIDEHSRAEAYDQVIVGYLLQIATELKGASDADTALLRRRTARLISALNPDTLRRLVEMGGNAVQRRAFVLDAAHGMAAGAVLEILEAASDVSGQTISHGLIRMLSKLASHAELGTERARPLADAALREQVTRLLSDWQLADPNPEAYARLLQRVTAQAPQGAPARERSGADGEPDPLRVLQMSLETGATGPLVDRAIRRAADRGAVGDVLQLLGSAPAGARGATDGILARLLCADTLATLLTREPLDVESLDRLLPLMPAAAYDVVLEALSTSACRATRRKLLDRLAAAPVDIGPLVVARLHDERWFVQRNLLVLLERAGCAPAGFSARPWVGHSDARVRHPAIRLQLTLPAERLTALRTALTDHDPRVVRLGLEVLRRECPAEVAASVMALAADPAADPAVRLLAVRALGACREPGALETLLGLVDGGRRLWRRPKLAACTPLVIAAVQALRRGWSDHERAARLLAVAGASSDAALRQAATEAA